MTQGKIESFRVSIEASELGKPSFPHSVHFEATLSTCYSHSCVPSHYGCLFFFYWSAFSFTMHAIVIMRVR